MIFHPITRDLRSSARVQDSEFLSDLCTSIMAIYPDGPPPLPWIGYLAEDDGVIVGTCAFKSAPVAGHVEIAYFTFPEYERRGVATRMAQHLIDLAGRHGAVIVRAQTLPERNPSVRILEKLGFELMGPVLHPEDGEVWEWRRPA